METKSWTTMDKSDWGDGPWQDEPDKMQWTDEKTGLPCLMVRSCTGAWCGYVGVAEGHPWYKVRPYEIDLTDDVHGGLNFGSLCQDTGDESQGVCHIPAPGEPDHVYWLGFDCGHAWDIAPANDALCRGHDIKPVSEIMGDACVYRDLAYVQNECRSLAAQAAEAGTTPAPTTGTPPCGAWHTA